MILGVLRANGRKFTTHTVNSFTELLYRLLHHFVTVAGSLCNVFANHLLIIPLSANTVLIRVKSAMLQLFVVFAAKLLLLTGNKDYIHIKLPQKCYFLKLKWFEGQICVYVTSCQI